MVNPKQVRELARNPTAFVKFQATGQLPRLMRPQSPLITLLEAIQPRYLSHIIGVTVGPQLGYAGSRKFHTAAQALHWIRPDQEVLAARSFPAESSRMKPFNKTLHLEDLLEHCSSWPQGVLAAHPRLRRPAPSPGASARQDGADAAQPPRPRESGG